MDRLRPSVRPSVRQSECLFHSQSHVQTERSLELQIRWKHMPVARITYRQKSQMSRSHGGPSANSNRRLTSVDTDYLQGWPHIVNLLLSMKFQFQKNLVQMQHVTTHIGIGLIRRMNSIKFNRMNRQLQ